MLGHKFILFVVWKQKQQAYLVIKKTCSNSFQVLARPDLWIPLIWTYQTASLTFLCLTLGLKRVICCTAKAANNSSQ